jgi:hypothetical protein
MEFNREKTELAELEDHFKKVRVVYFTREKTELAELEDHFKKVRVGILYTEHGRKTLIATEGAMSE